MNGPHAAHRRSFLGLFLGEFAGRILPADSDRETRPPLAGGAQTGRMVADLERALARPAEQRRWVMVIDTRRCIGCSACTVACIAENNLPPGVTYRIVPEVEFGVYPVVRRSFMPTNCMQCDDAPCVPAANAVLPGSMHKRPDGIVAIDYQVMKGRKVFEAAREACPYDAALYFDEGGNHTDGTPQVQAYEQRSVREYGVAWSRSQTVGSTRKCHFCAHRLDAGQLPACVTTCTGLAMRFGDAADAESLVAEHIARGETRAVSAAGGAKPRVLYVDDWPKEDPGAQRPSNRAAINCSACHTITH
jgi:molybdopterin-containing oxidoreductase family iron-sulfur binding subunit